MEPTPERLLGRRDSTCPPACAASTIDHRQERVYDRESRLSARSSWALRSRSGVVEKGRVQPDMNQSSPAPEPLDDEPDEPTAAGQQGPRRGRRLPDAAHGDRRDIAGRGGRRDARPARGPVPDVLFAAKLVMWFNGVAATVLIYLAVLFGPRLYLRHVEVMVTSVLAMVFLAQAGCRRDPPGTRRVQLALVRDLLRRRGGGGRPRPQGRRQARRHHLRPRRRAGLRHVVAAGDRHARGDRRARAGFRRALAVGAADRRVGCWRWRRCCSRTTSSCACAPRSPTSVRSDARSAARHRAA